MMLQLVWIHPDLAKLEKSLKMVIFFFLKQGICSH